MSDYLKMSMDELLSMFRRKFLETHGYNIVYLPTPVTVEWLADQVSALEWYQKYEIDTRTSRIDAKEPAKTAQKRFNKNPFK